MTQTREIAIFGGSFDPPTVVHQTIIRTLLDTPSFDEVWVMPSGERADKPNSTRVARRLAMLVAMKEELFAGEGRLRISEFEMGLPQPTETYNTVAALKRTYPNARFWFVFGADSIATMHSWNCGQALLQELPMIAIPRSGYEVPIEARNIQYLPDIAIFGEGISSTMIRQRVAMGHHVEGLVCTSIQTFIEHRGMYQAAVA